MCSAHYSCRQIFEKYLNIKFHGNPSSGSRDVPCGRTDGHTRQAGRQRDITTLTLAFRNIASAPNKDVLELEKETAESRRDIPAG
jgi:hypothetical protein